uniref:NADH-ubiquinone oxidoreductase chain 4L n=1 Tax=Enchiridium sp. MTA_2015 TaxID=1712692 RepID=A0A0P0CI06_9PLAT|nr:NADH dehydrogenase subunit 4L [Enchiridium sp. MTA_2015]ALI86934.1 NADH dehydrogenase subunit 4L [Enchiridium sp. MTA_2015]
MSYSLFILIFIFNILLLVLRVKNLLLILFAFEFLILNIFFMYVYLNNPSEISSSLVFLAVAAGEASLGLSLLVAIVRGSGKDSGESSEILSLCEGF